MNISVCLDYKSWHGVYNFDSIWHVDNIINLEFIVELYCNQTIRLHFHKFFLPMPICSFSVIVVAFHLVYSLNAIRATFVLVFSLVCLYSIVELLLKTFYICFRQ